MEDNGIRLVRLRPMTTCMETDAEYAKAVRAAARVIPAMTNDDVAFLAQLTGRDLRPALPAHDGDTVGTEPLRTAG